MDCLCQLRFSRWDARSLLCEMCQGARHRRGDRPGDPFSSGSGFGTAPTASIGRLGSRADANRGLSGRRCSSHPSDPHRVSLIVRCYPVRRGCQRTASLLGHPPHLRVAGGGSMRFRGTRTLRTLLKLSLRPSATAPALPCAPRHPAGSQNSPPVIEPDASSRERG